MPMIPSQTLLRKMLMAACGASLLLTVVLVVRFFRSSQEQLDQSLQYGEQTTRKVAAQMDSILSQTMKSTQDIAAKVEAGSLSGNELLKALKQASVQNDNVLGLTAAFEPYASNNGKKLYCPYYDKRKDTIIFCEDLYDYSDRSDTLNNWYVLALLQGPRWNEPGFGPAAGGMVADYGVPFYRKDPKTGQKVVAGTITATFSLKGLNDLLYALQLGKTGYGFALSQKGYFLAHPTKEYLKSRKSIQDIGREDKVIAEVGQKMLKKDKGLKAYTNSLTGQESWLFYTPLQASPWSVGLVFIKAEMLGNLQQRNHRLIEIALGVCLFLFLLGSLLVRAETGETQVLWVSSSLASVLFAMLIVFVWRLELEGHSMSSDASDIVITDYAGLNNFLASRKQKAAKLHEEKPIYIPTGVFVQEMEYIDANSISVSGTIWQKYPIDTSDKILQDLTRGFHFIEAAPDAEKLHTAEIYRKTFKDYEVIGWNFRATLRERFDYKTYPLDPKKVRILLRHADFKRHVVMLPDLDAYKLVNPTTLPGVSSGITMPGWTFERSFFGYKVMDYNANFGMDDYYAQENYPEFEFNIIMNRDILSPLISNFIPLIVISVILFGVLLSSSKKTGENEFTGFSTFGVLETSAAFFFAVMLAHIDLRRILNTEEVAYIEYFYFILYGLILFVAVNSMLFTRMHHPVVEYRDNLIAKLLYWPLLLGLCLWATLSTFYF